MFIVCEFSYYCIIIYYEMVLFKHNDNVLESLNPQWNRHL